MNYRGGISALLFSCYGIKIHIIIFRGLLSKKKQLLLCLLEEKLTSWDHSFIIKKSLNHKDPKSPCSSTLNQLLSCG